MTAIQLCKFVKENNIEYHWVDNNVVMFVNFFLLKDFNEVLGHKIFDENGIDCVMKEDYLCFWMDDICNYFDLDIKEVFDKNE